MGPWTLITVLLAMQVSASWTEECNDTCFCPEGKKANCDNRGLSQPPPGNWPQITRLYLRTNIISALNKWSLTGFPNVEVLTMERNLFTELDLETFSALPFLSSLDLSQNAIATITTPPPGLSIGSLTALFLSNNRISSFDPNVFVAATDLKNLILSNNPVTVQAEQPLLNHPKLEVLVLKSDGSFDLGPNTLAGLPMLKDLTILHFGVLSIQGAFVNNTLLNKIQLNENSITHVTAGCFSSGNIISSLGLSYNPLERLEVSALENALAPGAHLLIQDTPLACSCDFDELYWWAQERGVQLVATCLGRNTCSFTRLQETQ